MFNLRAPCNKAVLAEDNDYNFCSATGRNTLTDTTAETLAEKVTDADLRSSRQYAAGAGKYP